MEKTLLYHYTSLSHLIEIFKVGKVLTSQTEKMLKVKKPGLWFSTNSKWEYSAFKRFNDGKKEFDLNTPEEFEKYIGCARLITNLNSLFSEYLLIASKIFFAGVFSDMFFIFSLI